MQQQSGGFICSCYVNSSFGITCRHILSLRRQRNEPPFNVLDCLPRWKRDSPASSSKFSVFNEVAQAAIEGVPDEDIFDDTDECSPAEGASRYHQRGCRYQTALDRGKHLASLLSNYGAIEFAGLMDVYDHFIYLVEAGQFPVVSCRPTTSDAATTTQDIADVSVGYLPRLVPCEPLND